jgi:hypothetical protein
MVVTVHGSRTCKVWTLRARLAMILARMAPDVKDFYA